MFCAKCGVVLPDRATVCHSCGTAVTTGPFTADLAQTTKKQKILYYIFGSILILCGLIPLIFRGDRQYYSQYIDYLHSLYNYRYYTAITVSAVTGFLSTIPNLVLFLACSLSILSGFMMLKKCHNIRILMIITAVAQFLSLLCLSLFLDIFDNSPADILSLYADNTGDPYFISNCIQFLNQEPYLLNFFRQLAVLRNIIAIVVILSVLVFLSLAKPNAENKRVHPTRIPHTGIALMLFVLCILHGISSYSNVMIFDYLGRWDYVSFLHASSLFKSLCTLPCIFILLGIVALCVLTPKLKRYITALPSVLVLTILGAAVYLCANIICKQNNVPNEYYHYSVDFLGRMGLNAAAMLIGVFLWCQTVAQGRASLGWQIAIPVLMLILYPLVEVLLPALISEVYGLFWGFAAVGVLLSIISLCFRRPKAPVL